MGWLADWTAAHPPPPARARPKGLEFSYSQLKAFLDCPWLYHLRYDLRWRSAPTAPSALGQTIHRALELFHSEGAPSEARLLEFYEESWVNPPGLPGAEVLKLHERGADILRRTYAEERASKSKVEFVEREFIVPLGPHTVRGIIDRVDRRPDGTLEVIDYKTHLELGTEEDAAQDLQLRMYAWGLGACWAMEPKWLTWRFLAAGKTVSVPYDPAGEEELEAFMTRIADLIAFGRAFVPDTAHCPRCDLQDRCQQAVSDIRNFR
ncbi:MAG: PD-(D/E)XK nuclease family protein [Elusimicrobia bacterium]|nr:PD-(D/E)XK nuclease family protein [Elusimicrobiota bacterium]